MKKIALVAVAAMGVLGMNASARAGWISGQWNLSTVSSDTSAVTNWQLEDPTDLDLTRTESAPSVNPETLSFWGNIDSDPTLHIIEDITNFSGTTWTSYSLELVPDSNSMIVSIDSASSTPASSVTSGIVAGSAIIIFGGISIAPSASLDLDVHLTLNTASSGAFQYTVINTPVAAPEPASLGFLSLGGLMLLRRKR